MDAGDRLGWRAAWADGVRGLGLVAYLIGLNDGT